jgi:hypothetical protein
MRVTYGNTGVPVPVPVCHRLYSRSGANVIGDKDETEIFYPGDRRSNAHALRFGTLHQEIPRTYP